MKLLSSLQHWLLHPTLLNSFLSSLLLMSILRCTRYYSLYSLELILFVSRKSCLKVTYWTHSNCCSLDALRCLHCTRSYLGNSLQLQLFYYYKICLICIPNYLHNSLQLHLFQFFMSFSLWTTHSTHSQGFSLVALLLQCHIELLSWLH